ncbi:MAG TPA: hypothetical protein VEF89_19960 [Solirubrobacteraceae bacterium]|nr:hypothetical protein [Solirubrobacteraceae bacterium]
MSSYDEILWGLAQVADREPPTRLRHGGGQPWFEPTRMDPTVHGGRIATRLATDEQRRTPRRWRVAEEAPPVDTTPSFATMKWGPWPG